VWLKLWPDLDRFALNLGLLDEPVQLPDKYVELGMIN
jgi:hypothetical protein